MKIGKTTVKQEEYEVFNIENILKEICDEPDRLRYKICSKRFSCIDGILFLFGKGKGSSYV